MHFRVGIDEFGTATQRAEGWTLVSLADAPAAAFESEAAGLFGRGLTRFHGKEFTRRHADRYRAFLVLLREACRAGASGFIACSLNDETWQEEFTTFAERVMEKSFLKAGLPLADPELAMLRRVVPPLFTYLRLAARAGDGHTAAVTLDASKLTGPFNTAAVPFQGCEFTLPLLAGMLYRAYRRQCFPSAPDVPGDEIRTCPDEQSILVQAADVVGNFSTAYLFHRLGKRSGANDLKAGVFHDVFGDCGTAAADPEPCLVAAGDDLMLVRPGAYTLTVA